MSDRPTTSFEKAARPFGLAASAIIVFMMLHTAVAVVARWLFDISILSLVEYSELLLLWIIFLAIPGTLLQDQAIVVDIIDHVVPKRVSHALYVTGLVLTLVFLAVTGYAIIEPAMTMYARDQHTMVMEINRFYHWIPILLGFYASTAAVAWLLICRWRGNGNTPTTHMK